MISLGQHSSIFNEPNKSRKHLLGHTLQRPDGQLGITVPTPWSHINPFPRYKLGQIKGSSTLEFEYNITRTLTNESYTLKAKGTTGVLWHCKVPLGAMLVPLGYNSKNSKPESP
jgi:hypothetical protein